MDEPARALDVIAHQVIGAAIEVHRELGPGFGEAVYEAALAHELEARSIGYQRQMRCPVRYKNVPMGTYVVDLLVEDALIVELKSVDQLAPIHHAQLISYLRAANVALGLLINFNVRLLRMA
jgi:GxxExxY protein